ncbi:hypothetical protein D1872_240470 [compost metagenome]
MDQHVDDFARQLVVQIDFLENIEQVIGNRPGEKGLQQAGVRLVPQHHIVLMHIAFALKLRRNFHIVLHLHGDFLLGVHRFGAFQLFAAQAYHLGEGHLPFLPAAFALPEMQVGLMLKLIQQQIAAHGVEDPVFIQQAGQILHAEVVFVGDVIDDAHPLGIKPKLLHIGAVDGLPRKTQDDIGVIDRRFLLDGLKAGLSRDGRLRDRLLQFIIYRMGVQFKNFIERNGNIFFVVSQAVHVAGLHAEETLP